MNNQTQNPLLAFGTPAKVVINGTQATHPQLIEAYTKIKEKKPEYIRAIAFSIIDGIVKIYIKTTEAADNV